MDTFDSHRSNVPARLAAQRPVVPATIRHAGDLQESAMPSPITLRVALRGVRRYWWMILMLWVVGSTGIGIVIYKMEKFQPTYKASSLLRVDDLGADLYGVRGGGEQMDTFLATQVQLITSPNVLTTAGTNPRSVTLPRIQTAADVVQELKKVISVGVVGGTSLIEVSMTSQSALEAATLVNAVVDAFMESNIEWSQGKTANQVKTLEDYMADLRSKSSAVERQWRLLASKGDLDSGIFDKEKGPDGETKNVEKGVRRSSITLEQFKRVHEQLFNARLELAEAEAWLKAVQDSTKNEAEKNSSTSDDGARLRPQIARQFERDPQVIELASLIVEAKNKIDDLHRTIRIGGDPAVRKALEKVRSLEARYDQLWAVKARHIREQLENGGDNAKELRDATAKVALLKVKQATLQKEFDQLAVKNRRQAGDEVDLALIHDQRDSLKVMQEAVNRRLEQLSFEQRGGARIRVYNPATPPGSPISDSRYKYMAMTPIGVLGTVLGLILLLEIRSARVSDPDVLSARMRHEVFAIAPLPNIRPGDDANDDKSEQRLARFVQSLDHLRVALCEGGVPGEGRCVMITSATGGEGKTTLAAHLAARCANARTSTLLIDADIRRASLGRLLDVPVGPGLGDVLAGDIDFDQAAITVQAGGFHFLSAGIPGRDPSRVLKSARLSELLGRLRQTYDLVIIDTPPVLPVADALIVGRWADGAVMAARFDASRMPLVERANRQLAAAGIPVLGVVVNGVKSQHAAYGNYAYSYNYTGPGDRPISTTSA
jgi:succinoglycan biosynthesis transport protein ExoP